MVAIGLGIKPSELNQSHLPAIKEKLFKFLFSGPITAARDDTWDRIYPLLSACCKIRPFKLVKN
jgi:hypothetical protein